MNQRQKKKLIPSNTDYCYGIIGREDNGSALRVQTCPHYRTIGKQDDVLIDTKGIEHPCQTPIYYCTYAKVGSEEDVLLAERVKTCGEKLSRWDD